MLTRMEEVLGAERASRFHSHFSHIEFTPNGGEKCPVMYPMVFCSASRSGLARLMK